MEWARVLLALLAAALLQVLLVAVSPSLVGLLDPFLIVVVWFGLRSGPVTGQLVGTLAGLFYDGITGGLYGLHAFANTVVGYGAALASGRVISHQAPIRVVLFAAAALLQQVLVTVLLLVVPGSRELPSPFAVLGRVLVTGLAGALLVALESRLRRRWSSWQRTRSRRLRF